MKNEMNRLIRVNLCSSVANGLFSTPDIVPSGSQLFAPLLTIAAVSLGIAIEIRDGEYTRSAMALVTAAILATIAAVALWPNGGVEGRREKCRATPTTVAWARWLLLGLMGLGLVAQFVALYVVWPGVDLPHRGHGQLVPFDVGLGAAAVLLALGSQQQWPRIRMVVFPLVLAVSLLLSFWMVHGSADPHIDVWVFQQQASQQLLKGHNPYAMTFPDIYHSTLPGKQQVYGNGLVVNDRLQFGFPYPPVSLLLAAIGYAVAGDHRYAQAVAIVLAGLFIGYCRRGRIALLAAALLLFTPRVFFVLGRGWTEPFVVVLLAATIFCAVRRSRWLPAALGLFLATKQYLVFAVPLTFFLLPRDWTWRDWIGLLFKSAAVAVVVTLPLALWDFPAYWKSTVTVQQLSPFRWDALSFLVWYGFRGHLVTEPWTAALWSTLAALAALGFSWWKSARTPAGFAASLALISLVFFAFNKQAFCNYYFFVIGAFCCAIASGEVGPPPGAHDDVYTTVGQGIIYSRDGSMEAR